MPDLDYPAVAKVVSPCALRSSTREAYVLAMLRGRAGAPLLVSCAPEEGVLLMEDLGDQTMLSLLRSGGLSDLRWLQLLRSLAQSLRELHEAGFVHVDLKANNVMVTFEAGVPRARLIDFGLSEAIGRMVFYPPSTAPWYAPECFRGIITEASDVFSLSVLLRDYVLKAMRRPSDALRGLARNGTNANKILRPPLEDFLKVIEEDIEVVLKNPQLEEDEGEAALFGAAGFSFRSLSQMFRLRLRSLVRELERLVLGVP